VEVSKAVRIALSIPGQDMFVSGSPGAVVGMEMTLTCARGHMHWGSHVEVPNSISISYLNTSSLERSPATQVTHIRVQAETCLSRGALVEDGDDLSQVSPISMF
jgi:hypothetical protein